MRGNLGTSCLLPGVPLLQALPDNSACPWNHCVQGPNAARSCLGATRLVCVRISNPHLCRPYKKVCRPSDRNGGKSWPAVGHVVKYCSALHRSPDTGKEQEGVSLGMGTEHTCLRFGRGQGHLTVYGKEREGASMSGELTRGRGVWRGVKGGAQVC